MHPRNTPNIVSLPATSTNSLPFVGSSASPTTNQVPVYRVEGQFRTIYVTSDVNPAQWDTHSFNAIHALADGPKIEQEGPAKQPIGKTWHSSLDTRAFMPYAVDRKEDRAVNSPRMNGDHFHHQGVKGAKDITVSQASVSKSCDYCNQKPKFSNHPFCSKTCGRQAAAFCNNCHKKPKFEDFDYCGRTCAAIANPGGRRQTRVTAQSKGTTISEVHPRDPRFKDVASQFKATWRHKSACPPVRRVYKILPPQFSLAAYYAYKEKVESRGHFEAAGLSKGNEHRRWHGTRRACTLGDGGYTQICSSKACLLCSIIRRSYDIPLSWGASARGRLGNGIYTSSTSSKSDEYSHNDCESSLKAILLNNVVVGRECKVLREDTTLTAPPAGYDSVLDERGGSLNYGELIVYTNDAIRPSYLVMYENAGQ